MNPRQGFQTILQIPEGAVFKDVDDKKYSLRNAHVGHNPEDAVSYWNRCGPYHGAKSQAVWKWMLVKLLKEFAMLNFYDCDKNLSENDFNEVEKKLEVSFPSSFKSHYFKWNGGTPNLSCFVNDNIDYDYIEIRDFIPIKYSKQFEDDPDFTLEGRAINEWELNELPKNLIPFAFDWGGNYLCLEKNSWQIIYYVRDVWSENISREANFKKNSIIIAKSFEEFLTCLEENPDD